MRVRHWESIMGVCGNRLPMDENGPSAET